MKRKKNVLKKVNGRDMGLDFPAQWFCKEVLLCKANGQFTERFVEMSADIILCTAYPDFERQHC